MRRIGLTLCLVVFGMLLAVAAFAAEVVIPIPATQATIKKAGKHSVTVQVSGYPTAFSGGDPALPCKDMRVLLPPDTDISSVKIFLRKAAEKPVPGRFNIEPVGLVTTGQDTRNWRMVTHNSDIYGKNALYPSSCVTVSPENRLGEFILLPIRFWPYRYNPRTQKLVHIVRGDIVVSFSSTVSEAVAETASTQTQNTVSPVSSIGFGAADGLADLNIVNPQDALVWYGVQGPIPGVPRAKVPTKLVILTTADILTHSTQLAAFVTDKKRRGFGTVVYTESDWNGIGLTSDAAADAIRAFLRTIYNSQFKWYLLIIGDPSQTSLVPMKNMYPCGLPSAGAAANPTDFYYADTSGNWDLNANGYPGEYGDFGTGGIDVVPEFITGRIPYYGSITDLDSILSKLVAWNNATSTGAWAQRILYASYPSAGDTTQGWQPGEQIRADVATPTGKPFAGVYEEAYGILPTPKVVPCNVDTVANEWARGYGFVFWFTHGCDSVASNIWCPYHDDPIGTAAPSFVLNASCNNARPSNSWNLDYLLLLRHCISACGATELSWYRVWNGNGVGDCANQGWVYTYAYYLARDMMRSGDAFWKLKSTLGIGDCWANFVVYNMYGDPTIAPRRPSSFDIDTPPAAIQASARTVPYKFQFEATGGLTPYTWTLSSGTLPAGLTLSSSGLLSGTPTGSGASTFTLKAQSINGASATRQFSLSVFNPLAISTTTLAHGKVGSAYSVTFGLTGGKSPYTGWHGEPDGALAPGLTLNSSTGTLSGTPTTAGTYTLNIKVRDANKHEATRTLSLVIDP